MNGYTKSELRHLHERDDAFAVRDGARAELRQAERRIADLEVLVARLEEETRCGKVDMVRRSRHFEVRAERDRALALVREAMQSLWSGEDNWRGRAGQLLEEIRALEAVQPSSGS